MVGEGDAGRGIGLGDGAVDGEAGRLAHLRQERGLHGLLARGQHQLQVGAGEDVGEDGPGAAPDGLDRRQADGQREAVEVEVGPLEAAQRVVEDAEGDAAPALGMEGAVEEGLALHCLAVEGDAEGAVERGAGEGVADGGEVFLRDEGNRGAVREGGVALEDGDLDLAEEAVGGEVDAPAGAGFEDGAAAARGDRAAALGEGVDPHAGGVFALRGLVVPAGFAEGEQHGRIGDAVAVVGNGDADSVVGQLVGGDVDGGGAAAAAVLDELGEDAGDAGVVEAGDAVDGAPGARGRGWCRGERSARSWGVSPVTVEGDPAGGAGGVSR